MLYSQNLFNNLIPFLNSHAQPKETEETDKNNLSNASVLYEDSNVEVVYVPSQGGASTGSNLHPFRVHLENTLKSKRQEKTSETK